MSGCGNIFISEGSCGANGFLGKSVASFRLDIRDEMLFKYRLSVPAIVSI